MKYAQTKKGRFLSRPNRFIANVALDGKEVICHVKNTGRCRELLVPNAQVILESHPNAKALGRKTEYSLIGVYKETPNGTLLINMDSQAPNQVAYEWLSGRDSLVNLRREVAYGNSRFDLAFENGGRLTYMEVKGVTLEDNGSVLFPDAPTVRGVKHLTELSHAVQLGYDACVLFVIQMKGSRQFRPNVQTHPEFAEALRHAVAAGVRVLAYDCIVTENSICLDQPVPVCLEKNGTCPGSPHILY